MHIERIREMYIEMLKKTILFEIWQENELDIMGGMLNQVMTVDPEKHRMGEIWPNIAHSMIGRLRMDNLQMCMETVLKENIDGDFVETGVWRGGACIFMRGFLKVHGITDRTVWLADSFQGVPPVNELIYPEDKVFISLHTLDYFRVSLDQVQNNFQKYDLLDDHVQFLKGWFKDTLPTAPIQKISILRLDGDLYESTMDSLTNLYEKVSKGGFIIVDDYAVDPCKMAVIDFRGEKNITEPIKRIDNNAIYWRKHEC